MRRKGRRQPVQAPFRNTSQTYTFPAPRGGWVTSENLSATSPATAQKLENWFPTTTGIKLRGGSLTVATIGTGPVVSMMAYNKGVVKKLFAASATSIFDATSVVDPLVAPAPVVTGQTSGYYSYVNFTTSGGAYMPVVNGSDSMKVFDGTTWLTITGVSTPAITGVATNLLSFVWTYRNRGFFVEKGTLRAWFLPVDSIGGAAQAIVLDGVLDRGGQLLFGATWSQSSTIGLDEKCVFVSDQGQVAVYAGSDPAGTDWGLVGVYDITPPMGPRATMKAGGELVIATEDGLVPISAAVNRDPSSLALAALSRAIEPDWHVEATRRGSMPWEIAKWSREKYAIISLPITAPGQESWAFVVNTETGAWCKYTGWDTQCLEILNDNLYFGTSDGKVKRAEVGGSDDGALIYYTMVGNPDFLGMNSAAIKTIHQARTTFRSATPFVPKTSFSTNYKVVLPTPPNAVSSATSNEWDSGLWDVALWDQAGGIATIGTRWGSIGRTGYVHQPQVQVTGAISGLPNTELVQIDVTYEVGGVVV